MLRDVRRERLRWPVRGDDRERRDSGVRDLDGVLRGVLRRGTILENNIVHTIASSGESLAAGVIFTIPAIVLLGIWGKFDYLATTMIAMTGGVIGVTMMVPLRKAMMIEQEELRFPEGVACAEVLKAGDRGGEEMKGIFSALAIGSIYKIGVDVVGLMVPETSRRLSAWASRRCTGRRQLAHAGGRRDSSADSRSACSSCSAARSASGWRSRSSRTAAGSSATRPTSSTTSGTQKIRFFGIGAMVVGGVYSIVKVAGSISAGVASAVHGLRFGESKDDHSHRTDDQRARLDRCSPSCACC